MYLQNIELYISTTTLTQLTYNLETTHKGNIEVVKEYIKIVGDICKITHLTKNKIFRSFKKNPVALEDAFHIQMAIDNYCEYFITNNPNFLTYKEPKLKFITPKDFIPDDYLPNSSPSSPSS